jgi:hypothetical protein
LSAARAGELVINYPGETQYNSWRGLGANLRSDCIGDPAAARRRSRLEILL